MTHASRDTSTGFNFEQQVMIARTDGENLSKTKLAKWCRAKGVEPKDYLSWVFQPDEAYYLPKSNEIIIYEKKSQNCCGSADEKLGNCAWKIKEYKDLFHACGIDKVSYVFIFNEWFKQERYTKLLKYIQSVDGCDYMFDDKIKHLIF